MSRAQRIKETQRLKKDEILKCWLLPFIVHPFPLPFAKEARNLLDAAKSKQSEALRARVLEPDRAGLQSRLCPIPAVRPQALHCKSLCLSFLRGKMGLLGRL